MQHRARDQGGTGQEDVGRSAGSHGRGDLADLAGVLGEAAAPLGGRRRDEGQPLRRGRGLGSAGPARSLRRRESRRAGFDAEEPDTRTGLSPADGEGAAGMIFAVAKNRLMNLKRARAAFVLAFVLPVAFFTIFAAIFAGSGSRAATRKIEVLAVDEDQSANSRRFLAGLRAETGLNVQTAAAATRSAPAPPYTAANAEAAVRRGDAPIALIIPKGFGEHPISFEPAGN